MKKERVVAIYANTWNELTVKMLPWHHDHCWHYYAGRIEDLPDHLHDLVYKERKIGPTEEMRYIFLCEEDEPVKAI